MSFFYDLNKRLADLASKQDLHESKVAESEKWIQKAVNPAHKGNLHRALHVAQGEKIPAGKLEKATHSSNPKIKKQAVLAKTLRGLKKEDAEPITPKQKSFAKLAPPADKITYADKIAGAKKKSKTNEGMCPKCGCSPCSCRGIDEADLDEVSRGEWIKQQDTKAEKSGKKKFNALGQTFNTDEIKEKKEPRSKGTAFDPEAAKSMFAHKDEHPRHDVKDTGYSKRYTRKHEDDLEKDDDEVSTEPKRKGRPKGPAKGPERTTKGAWKHKGERKVKENEVAVTDRGEYDDEAGMAKDSLHTIVRHAKELERALHSNENLPEWVQEKIGQIKGMMSSVTDYIISTHERDVEQHTGKEGITIVPEVAPPGAKAERMVKGIKKSLSKDGHLSDKDKAIAYATTWKAHKQGKVEEESTAEKDDKAEQAGKKVAKDIEYDDKKDKEEKVDETTVAGSVATATPSGKSSKGGMQFGKGVYESFNNSVEQMITESITVQENVEECGMEGGQPSITIQADGEEAAKLMMLLKLAGLEGNSLEENKPDWPTNTAVTGDDDPYLRRLSGGLNGPKSTGQTTIPVIAGQRQRTSTMEENVELERTLFKTWKNYKG
jgi:hypothetical protein